MQTVLYPNNFIIGFWNFTSLAIWILSMNKFLKIKCENTYWYRHFHDRLLKCWISFVFLIFMSKFRKNILELIQLIRNTSTLNTNHQVDPKINALSIVLRYAMPGYRQLWCIFFLGGTDEQWREQHGRQCDRHYKPMMRKLIRN